MPFTNFATTSLMLGFLTLHAGPAFSKTQGETDVAAFDLKKMKRPLLRAFTPQLPKRIELQNGMIVHLQEDHELPLIKAQAMFYGGSENEPANKVGLVSIFDDAWRAGGTKSKTGDEIDDLLEGRAASIEARGSDHSIGIGFDCLKDDFEFVFEIFNDLLRNPIFEQSKIEIAKAGESTSISRRNDNMGQIGQREAQKLGYGAQSPYAREPEYATIAAVTRQDLVDWHAKYVHPNNMILGITGDFDSVQMEAKIRKLFDGWKKGEPFKRLQLEIPAPKPGFYFVEKNDVSQSIVSMVAAGIRRDSPDYFAAEVMNQIFGNGFNSRLFTNLRTKAGLAYSVSGGVESNFGHPGLTQAAIITKSETTLKAISALFDQIEKMQTEPPTLLEVQKAKEALLNAFIFEFDSKAKMLSARLQFEFYGYPQDFLEKYRKGIEAVTLADVNRVANKYLDNQKFAVLVVGNQSGFEKPLSFLGAVTTVDISIPK